MDKPKGIPQWRGATADERGADEVAYSAPSYSAQYGVTVEQAEEFLEDAGENPKHGNVMKMISAHYQMFPEERKAAIRGTEQQPHIPHRGEDSPIEVEGFVTPQRILPSHNSEGFGHVSKHLIKIYGKEAAEQLIVAALEDEDFHKWLDMRIGLEDHNLSNSHFHLDDVAESDRGPTMRLLANKYLESLMGRR